MLSAFIYMYERPSRGEQFVVVFAPNEERAEQILNKQIYGWRTKKPDTGLLTVLQDIIASDKLNSQASTSAEYIGDAVRAIFSYDVDFIASITADNPERQDDYDLLSRMLRRVYMDRHQKRTD